MTEIRDAIHGSLFLNGLEVRVLDTPEVQRLRRIKCLGFTYLVYPGANHTRFEHSLGVLTLAGKLASLLKLSDGTQQSLRLAGLLHDIGHGPFSHTSDLVIQKHLKDTHEAISAKKIRTGQVGDILREEGIHVAQVAELVNGKGRYAKILHSELDVDRMDYLVRDSHYTGVAYGVVDLDRLLTTLRVKKGELIVTGGTQAAESLLRARFLMYPTVYEHHTSRIAESMFARAVNRAIADGYLKAEELTDLDDIGAVTRLRNSGGYPLGMMDRIDNRRLFKRAAVMNRGLLGKSTEKLVNIATKFNKILKLEDEIAKAAKLEPGEVILDIPIPLHPKGESEVLVELRDRLVKADEASVSIRTLEEAQWDYWNSMVFCDRRHKSAVVQATEKVLGVNLRGSTQEKLTTF